MADRKPSMLSYTRYGMTWCVSLCIITIPGTCVWWTRVSQDRTSWLVNWRHEVRGAQQMGRYLPVKGGRKKVTGMFIYIPMEASASRRPSRPGIDKSDKSIYRYIEAEKAISLSYRYGLRTYRYRIDTDLLWVIVSVCCRPMKSEV